MKNLGVHSFIGNSPIEINYFIEGVHGNFLFGSGKGVDQDAFDFIQSKGGLSKVFNLGSPSIAAMGKIFQKFGTSEVRCDHITLDDYPIQKFGSDFVHPQISLLQTDKINHFLLRQRERNILFLDPAIRFFNQQFHSPYDMAILSQSLLRHVEKIDYCGCFFPLAGNHFFALLPGLLERKISEMERI